MRLATLLAVPWTLIPVVRRYVLLPLLHQHLACDLYVRPAVMVLDELGCSGVIERMPYRVVNGQHEVLQGLVTFETCHLETLRDRILLRDGPAV